MGKEEAINSGHRPTNHRLPRNKNKVLNRATATTPNLPLLAGEKPEQGGWVKVYRKILDHPVFKSRDTKVFKTFMYCLLRATHKETKIFFNHQLFGLKPGEFITGHEQAARDLGFSPKTFDRKCHDLQIMQIMTRTMTRRFSIISITNWDTYQGKAKMMTH